MRNGRQISRDEINFAPTCRREDRRGNMHVFGNAGDVCVLYLRIIKIIEVVEDGDLMAGRAALRQDATR